MFKIKIKDEGCSLVWENETLAEFDDKPSHTRNGLVIDPDIEPAIKTAIKNADADKRADMLTSLALHGVQQ